ncbi:MAG: hypothetical protein JWM80_2093, partial [Cyanobacteria bacterium RYN_339]|nr:hypothetical protein [Cyanobacteria bacterium RYN_339]
MQPYASLRARVIVLLCGCLALMLGLLGLVINEANTRAIIEQNRVREAMFAHNVQISINQVLFAGKYQAQAYVESLMKDTEGLAYVAIIDGATRRVLVHADAQKVGQRWDDPVTEQALAALRTGKVIVQQHVTPDGYTIHDWALPYVHGYMHRPAGIIRIGIHCNVEQDLIRRSRLHTVGLFLAFLLAGAGLAVALSYRLSASLANLVAERTSQLDVANRHLRETKARLVAFIDNADAVIYMKDTEGRYLLVNRSFEAALGLPRDAILGKMDRELVPPEIAAGFHASDL